MHSEVREAIFDDVDRERKRQIKKWGPQHHDPGPWMSILTEEFFEAMLEVGRAVNDDKPLRNELVQVAAVAVAWLEDIDNGWSDD